MNSFSYRPVAICGLALLALMSLAQAQSLQPTRQLSGRPLAGAGALEAPQMVAVDFIVAIVNTEPITNQELRTRLLRTEQQIAAQGASLPPRDDLTRQVLERLIGERAQIQHATETGIKVDDAAVDLAVQNIARQNQMDSAELVRRVKADGIDIAQFRRDLRNQLMLQRVRERDVDNRVQVSDQDVEQYLKDQATVLDPSTMEINVAQILVATPETATAAQLGALQARARRALERARAGDDFAELVREYSDATGLPRSGQLGLKPVDRYPEVFVNAVRQLAVGAVADLVRTDAGFHVLKLAEKQQAGAPAPTMTQHLSRHILLKVGAQRTEDQAREQLSDIRRQIVSGRAQFPDMARQHSQDGSAVDGGNLGWSEPGMFVPEFDEVLSALSPGEVSQPIATRFGIHLIQLNERRTVALTEAQQKELARNGLRERKAMQAFETWAQDVRGRAYVELLDTAAQ
jgi:peptidyl-prolyl cis-trans isomerase SurA